MPRVKKTVSQKLSEKGKDFVPFHIDVRFRDTDEPWTYKMVIIKIREIPQFHMYIGTWDRNPSHFGHVTYGNVEFVKCKGHAVAERVGGSESFSKSMSLPAEGWGDIPDDVRFFIKDTIQELVTEVKENGVGWALDVGQRYGLPLISVKTLIDRLNGVCMARVKKGRAMREVKEETIEIDDSLGDAKSDNEES